MRDKFISFDGTNEGFAEKPPIITNSKAVLDELQTDKLILSQISQTASVSGKMLKDCKVEVHNDDTFFLVR